MKKNIAYGVLALIAVVLLIYNYFIKGGEEEVPPAVPQFPTNNAATPAAGGNQGGGKTPGSTVAASSSGRKVSNERFKGYEEIVKEIYIDYENEKVISKDIRNIFKDFKLSPEMHRKAKEAIFTVEAELQNFEALSKTDTTSNAAEYVKEAEDYLKLAKEALADKNYLKAELFGRKSLIEIKKMDVNNTQGTGNDGKKGPNVSIYYKGFLIADNTKIAILKRMVTFTDIAGSEDIELLKLKIGDEINLGLNEDYIIMDILEDEVVLKDKINSRLKRSVPIDKKF